MSVVVEGLGTAAIQSYTRALVEVHTRLATDHACTLTRGDRRAHAVPVKGLGYALVRLRGEEQYRALPTSDAAIAIVDHVLKAA